MFKLCSALLVLALALAAPGPASSQTFDGGVKGGLAFTDIPRLANDLEDAGADEVEWRLGRALGGFLLARIRLSPQRGIRIEQRMGRVFRPSYRTPRRRPSRRPVRVDP